MARLHTGRRKVLSCYRSYHGGTDTINLTGDPRRYPNDYGSAGVRCTSTALPVPLVLLRNEQRSPGEHWNTSNV